MDYFPLFMSINDRQCLVVGGGEVATRKIALLRRAGAKVHVLAPTLTESLKDQAEQGEITHDASTFDSINVSDYALVIAATDDAAVNQKVSEVAQAVNIPVNVVDNPDLCSFIVPSIIDRSPVQVAVSTGGASPVLARTLRTRLETLIPSAYGQLGKLLEANRAAVKAAYDNIDERRRFWENVLAGPIIEMVLAGQHDRAQAEIDKAIQNKSDGSSDTGEVYLVGAGPGDPDLLTFRALRLMQQSDVIVHDRLVSQPILDMARKDADFIYVGKERDKHTLQQEDINHLLVRLAREGKRVCRLKGGDPFVFGRGGEEIDTLTQEGIPFQVVPAITAALGVASYAGIPLTHRDYAHSVLFTTGHLKDGTMNLNWSGLVQPRQTVVFYMGLHGVDIICKEMIAHGMPTTMPIALVQKATLPDQKVITGTLESMPKIIRENEIHPPTLIIVGEVVKLHEKLNWFQTKK